jgi:hypothetical protein
MSPAERIRPISCIANGHYSPLFCLIALFQNKLNAKVTRIFLIQGIFNFAFAAILTGIRIHCPAHYLCTTMALHDDGFARRWLCTTMVLK